MRACAARHVVAPRMLTRPRPSLRSRPYVNRSSMLSVRALLLLVLCAANGRRACAASTPTPGPTLVAELACSNGTDARSDKRTACPNLLYFAWSNVQYPDEQLEIYNVLKSYVDATLSAEGDICTGPHGTTLVTTVASIPTDLSVYTQIVRPRTCALPVHFFSSRSVTH